MRSMGNWLLIYLMAQHLVASHNTVYQHYPALLPVGKNYPATTIHLQFVVEISEKFGLYHLAH